MNYANLHIANKTYPGCPFWDAPGLTLKNISLNDPGMLERNSLNLIMGLPKYMFTLPPIIMEVENGSLEDEFSL